MAIQFVGARYVPKFYDKNNGEWQPDAYEPMTIVLYKNSSYTSKVPIPNTIGNPVDNPEYWAQTGNYNGQWINITNKLDEWSTEYGLNVTDNGAKGDGIADDTLAIQKTIDKAFNNWLKNPYTAKSVIYFPEGHYIISSTINIPYCVHLYSVYPVILEYTGNSTLLHFYNGSRPSYESSPLPLRNRPYNGGKLISSKSCFLLAKKTTSSDLIAEDTGTAIEIGDKNALDNTQTAGGITIENVYMYGFTTGLHAFNNTYIFKINNCSFELCRYGVIYEGTYNSGEAYNFNQCVFAKNLISAQISGEANFIQCSFDFINTGVVIDGTCNMMQCHLEGIGKPYDTTDNKTGYYVVCKDKYYNTVNILESIIYQNTKFNGIVKGGNVTIKQCHFSWVTLNTIPGLYMATDVYTINAEWESGQTWIPCFPTNKPFLTSNILQTNYAEYNIALSNNTTLSYDSAKRFVLTKTNAGDMYIEFTVKPCRTVLLMAEIPSITGTMTSFDYYVSKFQGAHAVDTYGLTPPKRSETFYSCGQVLIPDQATLIKVRFRLFGNITSATIVPYIYTI